MPQAVRRVEAPRTSVAAAPAQLRLVCPRRSPPAAGLALNVMGWVRLIKGLPLHLFVKDYPLQMSSQIPRRIPRCAVNLLARAEWFADPLVVSRARLGEAKGIPRLL